MQQTIRYGEHESQTADLHLPDGAQASAVVCLLHGGFWRFPHGREQMAAIAHDLVSRGYAVWNIGYRRIGEIGGGWPGTLADVVAAIDHLALLAADGVRLDLSRVVVAGHSAGGHLALSAVSATGAGLRSRAAAGVAPIAVCGLAAITDLHDAHGRNSGNGAAAALLGGSPDTYPERYAQASPLRQVPLERRVALLHGDADAAVPVAQARAYVSAARRAGNDVDYIELPGMGHMEYLDPASAAHAAFCGWLADVLAQAPSDAPASA